MKNCINCSYFRTSRHTVIAPIENMIADGVCENEKHKNQPIVLDSKTDTCDYFENKKPMKNINLYFDFEFTSLSPEAQPISLGIVSDEIIELYGGIFVEPHNNKQDRIEAAHEIHPSRYTKGKVKSFYAEFADFDINRCDDWVKENVVSKLKFYKNVAPDIPAENNLQCAIGNVEVVSEYLKQWLSQFSDYQIQFVKDAQSTKGVGLDWIHLIELLRIDNPPKNWSYIKLTRNYLVMVDRYKYDELMNYKWYATISPSNPLNCYATAKINGKTIKMHRFLMGEPPFENACVDHINGNSLDCRISNLRWITKAQNNMNVRPSKSECKYKGVTFRKHINKYEARITKEGKTSVIGYFDTELDAAKAYNQKCTEYFGEYARPNKFNGFPKLPANISPVPQDLNDLVLLKYLKLVKSSATTTEAFYADREILLYLLDENKRHSDMYEVVDNTYKLKSQKHNALWDAKVIKEIYNKLK